jgi:hypothetical protein
MADAPKGYFNVPGTDTAVQIYGRAVYDLVLDTVGNGGVLQGLSAANPKWSDDALPKNQFDSTIAASRFGIRTVTPSAYGDIKTRFEMDFNGTKLDKENTSVPWTHYNSGETRNYAHVRQMYGEVGGLLIGKTDSTFEDPDGSPNYIDQDGLLGDWYGNSRVMTVRYLSHLNDKTDLYLSMERNEVLGAVNSDPTRNALGNAGTDLSRKLPGTLAARLQYADKWGHISFAGAFDRFSQFSNLNTAGTGTTNSTPAHAATGSTWESSINVFSWRVAGHFQFGDDSFVYTFGRGAGQNGAGLEDGVAFKNNGDLTTIYSNQFEAGYEHFWTPKVHTNLLFSYVGYKRDTELSMTGNAFSSYIQYGANVLWDATRTMHYGFEYLYGAAKTFDKGMIINPDGSTTDAVHESKLHFQVKFNFN